MLALHKQLTLTGLYNVLEKLRAGARPETFEEKDRRILEDGLLLILKELHDKLDLAVAPAYGWATDAADEEILSRLVALNRERAEAEERGEVIWQRPEYQKPSAYNRTIEAQLNLVSVEPIATIKTVVKKAFPSDETAQTAAVMAMLAHAMAPVDADTVAKAFKQGKRTRVKVASILSSLLRMGYVDSADGRTFLLRRAA